MCFFYMTAEVSVLLIPAVPVCQSIESPQCIFFSVLLRLVHCHYIKGSRREVMMGKQEEIKALGKPGQ